MGSERLEWNLLISLYNKNGISLFVFLLQNPIIVIMTYSIQLLRITWNRLKNYTEVRQNWFRITPVGNLKEMQSCTSPDQSSKPFFFYYLFYFIYIYLSLRIFPPIIIVIFSPGCIQLSWTFVSRAFWINIWATSS